MKFQNQKSKNFLICLLKKTKEELINEAALERRRREVNFKFYEIFSMLIYVSKKNLDWKTTVDFRYQNTVRLSKLFSPKTNCNVFQNYFQMEKKWSKTFVFLLLERRISFWVRQNHK